MEKQYGDIHDEAQGQQPSSVGPKTNGSTSQQEPVYGADSKPSQASPEDQYTVEPETDEDLDQEYREELDYHSNE